MNISKREVILAVVAFYFIIGFLGYQYFYYPAEKELFDLRSQKSTVLEQISRLRNLEKQEINKQGQLAALAENMEHLDQLEERLPGDQQYVEVIDMLGKMAQEKGLQLQSLTYKDAAGDSQAGVSSISFNLSLAGPYYQLLAFLSELESYPRIINIDSVNFTMAQKQSISDATGGVQYNLNPPPLAPESKSRGFSLPSGSQSVQYKEPKQPESSKYDTNNLNMKLQITTYYDPSTKI